MKWIEKLKSVIIRFKEEGKSVDEELPYFIDYVNSISVSGPSLNAAIDSLRKDPDRAVLNNAFLKNADIQSRILIGADLRNIVISHAKLNRVDFTGALLTNAIFDSSELNEAVFVDAKLFFASLIKINARYADFSFARLDCTDFSFSRLWDASFRRAILWDASFIGASLWRANFDSASLWATDLTRARLDSADFLGSYLKYCILSKANFWRANLKGSIFEPKILPNPRDIAYARNLDLITYEDNPSSLMMIKKSLYDVGFRSQGKEINTALRRQNGNIIENILFDFTCEYGANPGLPFLWLVLALILSWIVYGFAKISCVGYRKYYITSIKGLKKEHREKNNLKGIYPKKTWEILIIKLGFSIYAATRIGFRDFSPSSWLIMFLAPGFEYRSRGWPRIVAGAQSLLSIYLIALAILSYFGYPFDY